MPEKNYPSIELIRQCFREDGGRLFWLARPRHHFLTNRSFNAWNSKHQGKEAGGVMSDKRNYRRWLVRLGGCHILRHKIVWAIHNGEWADMLDHRNRNSLDDSIGNLRIATRRQNICNSSLRKDNTSGYKGVTWDKVNLNWIAQIGVNGKHVKLGRFSSAEKAHSVYLEAAKRYFGEFACAG